MQTVHHSSCNRSFPNDDFLNFFYSLFLDNYFVFEFLYLKLARLEHFKSIELVKQIYGHLSLWSKLSSYTANGPRFHKNCLFKQRFLEKIIHAWLYLHLHINFMAVVKIELTTRDLRRRHNLIA